MTTVSDRRAQQAHSQTQPRRLSPTSPSLSSDNSLAHDSQPPYTRAAMPFANGTTAHLRDDSWSLPPQTLRHTNALSMGSTNDAAAFGSDQPAGNSSMAPIGTPSAARRPPSPRVKVLIAGLPAGMTEDALSSMLVWAAQDILSFKLEQGPMPDSLMKAHVYVSSIDTGRLIHKNLDGHQNTAKTSAMTVDIFHPGGSSVHSAASASREVSPTSSGAATTSSASTYGGTPNTRSLPQSRFNIDSALNGLSRVTSETQSSETDFDGSVRRGRARDDEPHPHSMNGSAGFPTVFGSQSPNDQTPRDMRMSGKSFIENNSNDDETSALIRDPVAFAESGPSATRSRASTQIPIDAMNSLSLNTNISPQNIPSASSSLTSPHGYPMSPTGNGHPPYMNGSNGYRPEPQTWSNNTYFQQRQMIPPSNPADQNAPCNTLYVGNLPLQTNEEELKAVFSKQRGYKRLCFRTKNNGPMCFVEFEDTSFATKALKELYGYPLHNSTKGGIRLSFSKNPLGVRSQHHGNQSSMSGMNSMHGASNSTVNGFPAISGPPPGLSAPPGLGPVNQHAAVANGNHAFQQQPGYSPASMSPWNGSGRGNFNAGGQTTPGGMNGINGSHVSSAFGFNSTPGPVGRGSYGMPPSSAGMTGSSTPTGYFNPQNAANMPPHMMGR